MFSQAYVKNSVHMVGGGVSQHYFGHSHTPPGGHSPKQTPPSTTGYGEQAGIILGDIRWTLDGYVTITVYLHKTPVYPSPWKMTVT